MFLENFVLFFIKLSNLLESVIFYNLFKLFGNDKINLPVAILPIIGMIFISIISLRFFPLKAFFNSIKFIFVKNNNQKNQNEKSFSNLEMIASSVSSATGIGFLAGISSAVCVFGPGVVFYIPIAAFFASCIRFIEVYLVHKYRKLNNDGFFEGGPEVYIQDIFSKFNLKKVGYYLTILYALIIVLSSFIGPAMLEINQIVKSITIFEKFNNSELFVSIFFVLFVAFIIFGNVSRIVKFFSFSMPFLIFTFFFISLVTIFKNKHNILNTFYIIYNEAFNLKSGIGGILVIIFTALRRILLGTEAGFGTASTIHAASSEKNSIKEAISGMVSPFIGSIFVAFLVGFLVVLTNSYNLVDSSGGITVLSHSLSTGSYIFKFILTIITVLMALNVMIGWSYYGIKNACKLFGNNAKYPYILLYLFCGFIGGILNDFKIILSLIDSIFFIIPILHFATMLIASKEIYQDIKKYENNN